MDWGYLLHYKLGIRIEAACGEDHFMSLSLISLVYTFFFLPEFICHITYYPVNRIYFTLLPYCSLIFNTPFKTQPLKIKQHENFTMYLFLEKKPYNIICKIT